MEEDVTNQIEDEGERIRQMMQKKKFEILIPEIKTVDEAATAHVPGNINEEHKPVRQASDQQMM